MTEGVVEYALSYAKRRYEEYVDICENQKRYMHHLRCSLLDRGCRFHDVDSTMYYNAARKHLLRQQTLLYIYYTYLQGAGECEDEVWCGFEAPEMCLTVAIKRYEQLLQRQTHIAAQLSTVTCYDSVYCDDMCLEMRKLSGALHVYGKYM